MRRIIFATLLLGLSLSGCAQMAPPYHPLKVSREEFFAKTKVVALAPLVIGVNADKPEAIKTQVESALGQKLEELGLAVIPSKEYQEIWERLSKQIGGAFDPITGKRDDAKVKTLIGYVSNELRTKHNADALLHPMIQPVKAPFNAGNARWHGTAEAVAPEGFWNKFLMGESRGTTSALSLIVTIENMNGVDLYVQAGGIQVLAKLNSRRQFVEIPRSQILTNQQRNQAAAAIALSGLTIQPPQDDAKQESP